MIKKSVSLFLCVLMVFSALVAAPFAGFAEGNFLIPPNSLPHIYIRSDGSIDPSTAPILRTKDVYTLTSNITNFTLEVERDNVVINGSGYTLSSDNKSSPAIQMIQRNNVTIKNMRISWFCSAHITMGGCTNCTITENTIVTVAGGAMTLNGCNHCAITNNTIYNGDTNYEDLAGESIFCSDNYNTISGNHFIGGEIGINLYGTHNTVVYNTFTDVERYPVFNQGNNLNTIQDNTIVDSETQTSPTPSPSPSPTIPELPLSMVAVLFSTATAFLIVLKKNAKRGQPHSAS